MGTSGVIIILDNVNVNYESTVVRVYEFYMFVYSFQNVTQSVREK